MAQTAPPTQTAKVRARPRLGLRCDACEVTWRGAPDEPCWSCGRQGVPAAAVVLAPG